MLSYLSLLLPVLELKQLEVDKHHCFPKFILAFNKNQICDKSTVFQVSEVSLNCQFTFPIDDKTPKNWAELRIKEISWKTVSLNNLA